MNGGQEDLYVTRDGGSTRYLERTDPVVYPQAGGGPLDAEQLARYERDGFLVLPGLLDRTEVTELRGALEHLRASARGGPDEGIIREQDGGEVRSVFTPHERSETFAKLVRDPRLVGAARQVTGDRVYIHQARVNFKPALVGGAFSWHSDFETWHAEDGMPRMRSLSVSVLLEDNHPWNGPLMLIPGSHKTFVSCPTPTPPDHYRASLVDQQVGSPSADAITELFRRAGRIEQATGPEGTVVLFDCNTLHASASNLSPLSRSNVFFVYNAICNRLLAPFGARHPRPEFLANRHPVVIS